MRRLFLVFALVVLAGCSARAGAPHVLRIADQSNPESLDPLLAHDQDTIGYDLLVTQTLVGLDADNRLVPVLLTRLPTRANGDISPDGRIIVYHLRRDVRFADGAPLTSADVAFTYRAIVEPRNPVLSQDAYLRIASLSTPDAHTVVIRLKRAWNAAVAELFAQSDFAFGILPAHAFASTAVVHASWEERAFGTGPFRVAEWRRGSRIVLVRNPYYRPVPKLQRIVLQMMPDFNSSLVAVQTGEIDVTALQPAQVPRAKMLAGIRVFATRVNGEYWLTLQTQRAPTDDVRVRRAIAYALDVPEIERAYYELFSPASTFLPSVLADWHDASIAAPQRNLQRAGALLDAAGWTMRDGRRTRRGEPLELSLVAEAGIAAGIEPIVQRQLAAVGIVVTIKMFPLTTYNAPDGPIRGGHFSLASEQWIGGADPEQSVILACAQGGENGDNVGRFCNAGFDASFADQATTRDPLRRRADFMKMQRIVAEERPIVPLNEIERFDAVAARVSGLRRNMLEYPVNAEYWDAR